MSLKALSIRQISALFFTVTLFAASCSDDSTSDPDPLTPEISTSAVVTTTSAPAEIAVQEDDGIQPIPEATNPVFSELTGAVLIFSDVVDGVLAIDLDNSTASRRAVEGEAAGLERFGLILVDDSLIVGGNEIYAAPLDGGASQLVDVAPKYFPAAEPGEIWTVTSDSDRTGRWELTIRRTNLAGEVQVTREKLDGFTYHPLLGVPGGLVMSLWGDGIVIWDAESDTVQIIDETAYVLAVASNGRQLAWCADIGCMGVTVVDLPTPGAATPQYARNGGAPIFSHDGTHLAFRSYSTVRYDLIVQEVGSSNSTTVATALGGRSSIQWGPSGQLFYASFDEDGSTTLGRYDLEGGSWEMVRYEGLDLRDVLDGNSGFIVVDRALAASFLPDELGDKSECETPNRYPSGRTSVCGFGF